MKNPKDGYHCCNPFSKHGGWKRGKLFPVSESIRTRFPSLNADDLLCNACRVHCYQGFRVKPQTQKVNENKVDSEHIVQTEQVCNYFFIYKVI